MITAEEERELDYLREIIEQANREIETWQENRARWQATVDKLTRKAQDEDA